MRQLSAFLQASIQARSPMELDISFREFLAEIGFDYYTLCHIHPGDMRQNSQLFGTMTNYPTDWLDCYRGEAYASHDPVYRMAMATRQSFSWKEAMNRFPSKRGTAIMHDAKSFGLKDGLGLSFRSPDSSLFGFGLASSERVNRKKTPLRRLIHLAAWQYYQAYIDIIGQDHSNPSGPLSPRERDILLLVADGFTKGQIAEKISVSESTVKRHCESIGQKLGSRSLAQSVAIAFRKGILL